MKHDAFNRRRLLKYLGVSSAGLAFASAASAAKEKLKSAPEDAKNEIENLKLEVQELKETYKSLDKKSKLVLRVVVLTSGLDIFFMI
jgi:hypothetical protein